MIATKRVGKAALPTLKNHNVLLFLIVANNVQQEGSVFAPVLRH